MNQKGVTTVAATSQIRNEVDTIASDSLWNKVVAAVFAVILGTVIIGATGFAPGYAHNAAHDTRHVMVFPCH